ncbi:unnamed protein product [Ostreobium quekettii]|uniref:Uncharacterized protein n=1 Tax=Ostreobium quekettii TaxID=121088 RepID=A0A8S1JAU2_9CHLO|nr:unnamed protein product [Ostreobium quekettii]
MAMLQVKLGAALEDRESALKRVGLERDVAMAKGELGGAVAGKEEADRQIEISEVEMRKLRGDLSRALGKNEAYEQRCEELEAELKEHRDELMMAKKNAMRIGTQGRKMEAERRALEARLAASEERAEASAAACSQCEEKLRAAEASARRMERELKTECERHGRDGADLLAANQEIEALRKENDRVVEECRDLRHFEAGRNKTIFEQKTANARLVVQLGQAKSAIEKLQEELRVAKRGEKEMQAVLHALRRDVKSCGWEPAKMDALLKQTKEEFNMDYARAKNERLEKERAQMKQEIKVLKGELTKAKGVQA